MKRFCKMAAALKLTLLAAIMTLMMAAPVFAAFNQSVLDGVILIY